MPDALAAVSPADITLLLFALGLMLVAGGATSLVLARHQSRRLQARIAHAERLANAAAMDVKSLIRARDELEASVSDARAELARASARPPAETGARPAQIYDQAIKLVQQGFDAEQLIHTCGLSRGEAELVLTLHRREGAPTVGHELPASPR